MKENISKILRSFQTIKDTKEVLENIAHNLEGKELSPIVINLDCVEASVMQIDIAKELIYISYTDTFGSHFTSCFTFDEFTLELIKENE